MAITEKISHDFEQRSETFRNHVAAAGDLLKETILESISHTGGHSTPGEPPHMQSGRLYSSIFVRHPDENTTEVGSELPYAGALEHGTSKMAARPWLAPAIAETEQARLDLIQRGD